jgi:galactokinase
MTCNKTFLINSLESSSSNTYKSLEEIYSNTTVIDLKIKRIHELISHPSISDEPLCISRCPGRISLSKHADYINSDLLYTLDDRDIFLLAQLKPNKEACLKLINSNHNFSDITVKLHEVDNLLENKSAWYFYPLKMIKELGITWNQAELVLNYSSDLPTGSGLSSSHALMLSTYFALEKTFEITQFNSNELIIFCQKVESERGFKSGLGDQSAQLFSKKGKFSFIKLFPNLEVSHIEIPAGLAIITAPSYIKADKSLPEFSAANENIQRYKNINELVKNYGVDYLADLLEVKNQEEIYEFLSKIENKELQSLALYGLGEASRVKSLKSQLNAESLGAHLNLSHLGERRFVSTNGNWTKINYLHNLDTKLPLTKQHGYYGASTLENDQLQALALNLEGVYGSTISGAGLGGNNLILAEESKAHKIKESLIENYYQEKGLEEKALLGVHISSSSAAAGIMLF